MSCSKVSDIISGTEPQLSKIRIELFSFSTYFFLLFTIRRRYTSNRTLFRQLIEASKLGQRRWQLGGNAPVMGIRFYLEGADVLLATQMSEKFV